MDVKKFLAGILACTVVRGAVAPVLPQRLVNNVVANAEDDEYTEGTEGVLTYRKYGDHVEISKCDEDAEGEVIIPDTIEGLPVPSIADGAFRTCEQLIKVNIPDSVENIGSGTFFRCKKLKSVNIPNGITSLDYNGYYGNCTGFMEGLFEDCESLEEIEIPDSVKNIGLFTFDNTALMNDQNGVKYAGKWVIGCDKDVTSANIKEGTIGIAGLAFGTHYNTNYNPEIDKKSSIKEISIPDSVKYVSDMAFSECEQLESIVIPNSVEKLGRALFDDCINLKDVKLPSNGVAFSLEPIFLISGDSSIVFSFFSKCQSLSSITIPDNFTSIGMYAFKHCDKLKSIVIMNPDCKIYNDPDTICNDSYYYSDEWSSNRKVVFNGTIYGHEGSTAQEYAEKYSYEFDLIENIDTIGTEGVLTYKKYDDHIEIFKCDMDAEGEVNIPDTIEGLPVTSIRNNTFEKHHSIKSIIIPNSITIINDRTFNDCSLLKSITIPDSVTSIGSLAFYGCSSLKSIVIPDKVTEVGMSAFGFCSSLESMIIENPDCKIYDSDSTINNEYDFYGDKYFFNGTIYGHEGSTAQAYAEKYGYKFEALGAAPEAETVYGDANDDGVVTIDDAVLIMQALANPDKYGVGGSDPNAMTEDGKKNADCYQPGSDITAMDALSVQRFLLGSVTELPEK